MGTHTVKEVAVVAHHEHRVLEVRQILLEPCHGFEVKVVGRFVEEKIVGVAEEGFGKQHAYFLVRAHVAHQHSVTVFLYAKAAQQRRGIALGVPTLELGEALLQLGSPYAVGIVEIRLGIERVLLLHNVPQHGMTLKHGVEHCAVVKLEVVLLQHAHTLAGALRHTARCGRELPAEHAHQRGLAGTIGTDYAIAVAGSELEIDVLKKGLFAELYT